MSKEKRNLPTIAELTEDRDLAKKTDDFNYLVNQNPPQKWVKEHPYISGHLYLPIDKVELMLKRLFKRYRIEVKNTKMMMNAVVCTVRVHYFHPVTSEWEWQDGIGADELQTQKDTGSLKSDMSNVQRGAVPMSAPIAETIAIKDACHKIGRIFGADLNRKDLKPFTVDSELQREPVEGEDYEMVKEAVKLGKENGGMSAAKAAQRYKLTEEQSEELYEIEEGK
jgi:hypothetical protein